MRVDRGTSNVGNMMAFLQYAMQILFSLLMASFMFIMLPRAQASAVRINEVLDTGARDRRSGVARASPMRARRATSSSGT